MNKKLFYVSPKTIVVAVNVAQSIAAGSTGTVTPPTDGKQIEDATWDDEESI